MQPLRLTHPSLPFWVDVHLGHIEGVWLASAETPDGPTLGWGERPMDALFVALDPYHGVRPELLASIEHEDAVQ
jgi:hypothetical protein